MQRKIGDFERKEGVNEQLIIPQSTASYQQLDNIEQDQAESNF